MRDGRSEPHKHAPPVVVEAEAPAEAPLAPPPAALPALPLVPTVGGPTSAAAELRGLLPASGEATGGSIVLALLAVLGGGTAWRFYRQRSRERHELALRELELKGGQQSSPDCRAEHVSVREELQRQAAQLEALTRASNETATRLGRVESRGESMELPTGLARLETRVARLERAAKSPKSKPTK